jgi:lipopolysaccharide/colanic/teichoic acid biosynthesis glycosyltransferase
VDLVVVLVALLVLAIPMLLVAMAIRLGTPGPALYRQRAVGRGSRLFTMYTFRTMRMGTFEDSVPQMTRFGATLRRTSIDLLPQLINVLRGQMALVGPRPFLDWEAGMLPPRFAGRFDVPPGVTGLWQVSGRNAVGTLEMWELDLAYVRSWSFWTDLMILKRTVPTLLRSHGAR